MNAKGTSVMQKTTAKEKKKTKLNAVDYFIIIAVILCIAGVGLRVMIERNGGSLSSPITMEEYIVSFKIENIRNTSTEYLEEGEQFYLDTTKQYFGEIVGSVSVTPALYFIEDINGSYIQAYAPENGDATRVDAAGTMRVSGYMSENGFLLGGTSMLAPNKKLMIRSKNLQVEITVTGIEKIS
jgi:hypothetical protein